MAWLGGAWRVSGCRPATKHKSTQKCRKQQHKSTQSTKHKSTKKHESTKAQKSKVAWAGLGGLAVVDLPKHKSAESSSTKHKSTKKHESTKKHKSTKSKVQKHKGRLKAQKCKSRLVGMLAAVVHGVSTGWFGRGLEG